MSTYTDFPRFREKVALVGFAPTTRSHIPFGDDSYEIWTVNEAGNTCIPSFEWVKRFDRLFQMHPRWDFSRRNNSNDPNYFYWLTEQTAPCIMCSGTGTVGQVKCPACDDGIYHPLPSRQWPKVIYMQEEYSDIRNSVEYPLKQMIKLNPFGKYFDSSVAYMLQLACAMNYKEILVVGFEMAAQTEYFYQRANFEMLAGYWKGQGRNIIIPQDSSLLKGPLYGYENMKTGYRQNLDMRLAVLQNEFNRHSMEVAVLEGELKAWEKVSKLGPLNEEQMKLFSVTRAEYSKKIGLTNLVKGAQYETENLRKLYDSYFMGNAEDGRTNVREVRDQYVKTVYGTE